MPERCRTLRALPALSTVISSAIFMSSESSSDQAVCSCSPSLCCTAVPHCSSHDRHVPLGISAALPPPLRDGIGGGSLYDAVWGGGMRHQPLRHRQQSRDHGVISNPTTHKRGVGGNPRSSSFGGLVSGWPVRCALAVVRLESSTSLSIGAGTVRSLHNGFLGCQHP